MSALHINRVYILESLPPIDRTTGNDIYYEVRQLEDYHQKGFEVEFHTFSTRRELEVHFAALVDDARLHNRYPILQIDAHGSTESLLLNSGEIIPWVDLEDMLRTLNVAAKCNLLLVMSTCFGAYVGRVISLLDRAPFWGVVGPLYVTNAQVIVESLSRFYNQFYTSSNPDFLAALTLPTGQKFKLLTSEWFFVKSYKFYEEELCNKKSALKSAKRIQKQAIKAGKNPPDRRHIRAQVRPQGEEFFLHTIRHFFMVDWFPENVDKISVTYNQIGIRKRK